MAQSRRFVPMLEFCICGVRCRLSLLFPALLTVLLLSQPEGAAVACVLASLIHEGGHLLAMVLMGVPPEDCTLSAFGARIRIPPHKAGYVQNIGISLAGPLANGVTAGLLLWGDRLIPATAHMVLAILNLLPSAALDGGQILRCVLCWLGLASLADGVIRVLSAVVLLLLAAGSLLLILQGIGNFSLLVVCGYLCALTFFSDKIEKNS